MNDEPEKHLDLHASEWAKEGKRQPFFGSGAYWFFRVIVPAFIATLIFGFVWKAIVLSVFG